MNRQGYQPATGEKVSQYNWQDAIAMVYEFRKPLENMHLSIEMLRSVIREDDQEIYLGVIMRSATRIDNLINSYLFYIDDAEKLTLEENPVHQLLNKVLEIAKEPIANKQVTVRKEYNAPGNKMVLNKPAVKIALISIIMNAINGMNQAEGVLKLNTGIIHDNFVLSIEANGRSTNGRNADGPWLATAFYILRSNYIGITVESEGPVTRFILLFKMPALQS